VYSDSYEGVFFGQHYLCSTTKTIADGLIQDSDKGLKWSPISANALQAAKHLIARYNQLITTAESICGDDEYVKLLKKVDMEKFADVAASKVKSLAEEISVYMESLDKRKALVHTASDLVKRGNEGEKWLPSNARDVNAGNNLVWEFNYLLWKAKILFETNPIIKNYKEITIDGQLDPSTAAREVKRLAAELESALTSF
jgi:hypothetical protein